MNQGTRVALVLALLSPLIAEMLSGSSPPLEFFSPLSFVILVGMYGAGVLLVREAVVRWRKGWASTLLLGAAYGIIEEGIAVKSFFDPGWVDIGVLGEYGRYMAVNWVWAFWLTIYHSIISIALPILIVGLLYPALKGQPLLGRRGLRIVVAVFATDIVFCIFLFAEIQGFMPPAPQYLLSFFVVAALIVLARSIRPDIIHALHPTPTWSPRRFMLMGLLFLASLFILAGSAIESVPPAIPIAMMLGMCMGALLLLERNMGSEGNSVHKAYFAVGLMLFLIMLAPVNEIFNGIFGMTAVAFAFALFSWYLVRRVRSIENESASTG